VLWVTGVVVLQCVSKRGQFELHPFLAFIFSTSVPETRFGVCKCWREVAYELRRGKSTIHIGVSTRCAHGHVGILLSPVPYTLHPTSYILNAIRTLHAMPYTLHP
jgi:hypothetical protein